jgi:hypothetical protein
MIKIVLEIKLLLSELFFNIFALFFLGIVFFLQSKVLFAQIVDAFDKVFNDLNLFDTDTLLII